MENSTSQESCALNPDGQLKDAFEITFYNSETDETPLAPVDEQAEQPVPKPRKVTKKPTVLPAQVVGRARCVQKPSFKAANVDVNASDIKRFFSRGSNSAEKNHHATQYPVLASLACDYLAIQGSSVPSERAFSGGGRSGTAARNRLSAKTFEALQVLKDGFRTGLISASQQAQLSAQEFWNDEWVQAAFCA
ncbi:hypothetical protein PHLCEN_2v3714 [Hermanssonia centrifuga]|uniref:HAT C-terminal dimerisation domain-containing protein n=1 Tax=Hermanssonia centrifuga TaxID=98765 RepID=A0A2R6QEE3_9APHY|nr:hypothetical protein PHLCEN_2v3714 [Hermanssonia centrifuga]